MLNEILCLGRARRYESVIGGYCHLRTFEIMSSLCEMKVRTFHTSVFFSIHQKFHKINVFSLDSLIISERCRSGRCAHAEVAARMLAINM